MLVQELEILNLAIYNFKIILCLTRTFENCSTIQGNKILNKNDVTIYFKYN